MLVDKQQIHKEKLSNEYIRGLVDGEGCFTFYSQKKKSGTRKIPSFILAMNERDKHLIEMVRDTMGLSNKIYIIPYRVSKKNGGEYVGKKAVLIVREFKQLKDIVIPFFYKKLKGYKAQQFEEWIEKIGSYPEVTERFKSLYRLYKWGMYDREPKFTERFKD